jgi:hypothetical protein
MNVLLDEMMPKKLRGDLIGHAVKTIVQSRWKGILDGKLLPLAQEEFDAFVTMDASLPSQQNLENFDLGFVIVHAVNNTTEALRPLVPQMLQALNHVRPGQVIHVPANYPRRTKSVRSGS